MQEYADYIELRDIGNEVNGGRLVNSAPYVAPGWSGGPLYGLARHHCPAGYGAQRCPYVGGVATHLSGSQAEFDTTAHAAGYRLFALATYAQFELLKTDRWKPS